MLQAAEASQTNRQLAAEQRLGKWLLALVLAALAIHRLYLAFASDFPINDGGLFLVFVKATAAVFPDLPNQIAYNGLTIPFAYPPLSFWIAGLLTRMGVDALAIVHLLPVAMNFVYLALFALLLRRNGQGPALVAVTLLFLATNLRAFEWLVMGGGLSRGLGSIFLMLTLLAVRVPNAGERFSLPSGRLMLAGAAVAGAILSHLEWGMDAAACVILSRALASTSLRDFIRSTLIAGITALLVISPWLALIIGRDGLGPLQAAAGASPWRLSGYMEHLFWLFWMSVSNLMVPIGLFLLVQRRAWFWPLFFLLCIFVTPRHATTPASLPIAIFAAQGAFWIGQRLLRLMSSRATALAVTGAFILLLAAMPLNRNLVAAGTLVRPLNTDERQAMDWVAQHHRDQSFVVLTDLPWWYDRSAEWFPVLAGARSVNTLQGREWLPDHAYSHWYAGDLALKTSADCTALQHNLGAFEETRFIWSQWQSQCFAGPKFRLIFANKSVKIFERVTA